MFMESIKFFTSFLSIKNMFNTAIHNKMCIYAYIYTFIDKKYIGLLHKILRHIVHYIR